MLKLNTWKKRKTKDAEAQENLKKAKFNFKVHLKTLIRKTSVDSKLLQSKSCLRNFRNTRSRRSFFGFQRIQRTIRFFTSGRQKYDPPRIEQASGQNVARRTTLLDEIVGQE